MEQWSNVRDFAHKPSSLELPLAPLAILVAADFGAGHDEAPGCPCDLLFNASPRIEQVVDTLVFRETAGKHRHGSVLWDAKTRPRFAPLFQRRRRESATVHTVRNETNPSRIDARPQELHRQL